MSQLKQSLSPLHVSPQLMPNIGKSDRTCAAILNAMVDFVWSHPFRDMPVNAIRVSAGLNNKRDKLDINKDGSLDLSFGTKVPEGKDANWIETVLGKGWFACLHLYGPLDPWFDKTWRPGEFEPIK